jgi:hypothetical protein
LPWRPRAHADGRGAGACLSPPHQRTRRRRWRVWVWGLPARQPSESVGARRREPPATRTFPFTPAWKADRPTARREVKPPDLRERPGASGAAGCRRGAFAPLREGVAVCPTGPHLSAVAGRSSHTNKGSVGAGVRSTWRRASVEAVCPTGASQAFTPCSYTNRGCNAQARTFSQPARASTRCARDCRGCRDSGAPDGPRGSSPRSVRVRTRAGCSPVRRGWAAREDARLQGTRGSGSFFRGSS